MEIAGESFRSLPSTRAKSTPPVPPEVPAGSVSVGGPQVALQVQNATMSTPQMPSPGTERLPPAQEAGEFVNKDSLVHTGASSQPQKPVSHASFAINPSAASNSANQPSHQAQTAQADHLSTHYIYESSTEYLRGLFVEFCNSGPQLNGLDSEREMLIKRAVASGDLFFLALHQGLCIFSLRCNPLGAWSQIQEAGMHLLQSIISPNAAIGQTLLRKWVNFPRASSKIVSETSPAMQSASQQPAPLSHSQPSQPPAPSPIAKTPDEYTQAIRAVGKFASEFAFTFPKLLQKCRELDRPPLLSELCPTVGSVLLKRLVFTHIAGRIWRGLSHEMTHQVMALFEKEVELYRGGRYSAIEAQNVLQAYQSLALRIRGYNVPMQQPARQSTPSRGRGRPRHYPAHLVSPRNMSAPIIPAFQRPLLPRQDVTLDQPAIPDPTMYGLHVSHLRDMPIEFAKHSENPVPTFQYITGFLLAPTSLDQTRYVKTGDFDLSSELSSSRAYPIIPMAEGSLAVQQVGIGSHRFRLQCKRSSATLDISEWASRKTHWPNLSLFKCNDERVEIRRKWQFGVCLPSDITNQVREGKNVITVLNLADRARRQPNKEMERYAFAVEVIKVTSNVEIEQQVLSSVRPAKDCLSAILGTGNSLTDDEVVSTRTIISLKDPILGGVIWKTPVRGKNCKHKDAFDLTAFLESRRLGRRGNEPCDADSWKCPICLADARPDMLQADGWLMTVRDELRRRGRLDAVRIEVSESGSWEIAKDEPHQQQQQHGKTSDAKPKSTASEVIILD